MKLWLRFVCLFAVLGTSVHAQQLGWTPLQLKAMAPDIVVGTVYRIYESKEVTPGSVMTRYLAEVRVRKVEKGGEIRVDGLIYVRYWKRQWVARQSARGTEGHRGLPEQGATLRIYLSRYTYDGFGSNLDGGFNVIGVNGFEKLPAEKAK